MGNERFLPQGKSIEEVIDKNMGLIGMVANWFKDYIPKDDLEQAGRIGVWKATLTFDPTKGYAWSTWASALITNEMSQTVSREARAIRLPRQAEKTLKNIRDMEKRLYIKFGRSPSKEEIRKKLSMKRKKFEDLWVHKNDALSLENLLHSGGIPEGKDDERTIEDSLAAVSDTEEEVALRILRWKVRQELEKLTDKSGVLTPKQKEVLIGRFGLEDGVTKTLKAIGRDLGVTKEAVRQQEVSALKSVSRSRELRRQYEEHFGERVKK